jgi:CubicO group peptidase (beta-lactamase class C family)
VVGCGLGYSDELAWKKLAVGQTPRLAEATNLVAVASVSKSLAGIALWQLYQQGKVDLDDNIVTASGFKVFNGVVNPAYASCSIRGAMVLTHSCRIDQSFQTAANIERDTGWKRPITFDQQMSYEVGKPTLQTVTGDYNNVGYALITRVIERASGMSFIDYVRTQILNPLGVSDENADMIFGGYQMCADRKWTTTQGVQYCTNFAAVEMDASGNPLARKPGEMFRDSSILISSDYDGRPSLAASARRVENGGAAFGLLLSPMAMLKIVDSYHVVGDEKRYELRSANPSFRSSMLLAGAITGSSVQIYREGDLSLAVWFNRSVLKDQSKPNESLAFLAMRDIFQILREKENVIAQMPSVINADQQVVFQNYRNSQYNYYFAANPRDANLLDQYAQAGFSKAAGEGEKYAVWGPGVYKNFYRFYYDSPDRGTHFFGTYKDARAVLGIYPQLPLWPSEIGTATFGQGGGTLRYESTDSSVKEADAGACPQGYALQKAGETPLKGVCVSGSAAVEASGICEAGLVPVYRLFRSADDNIIENGVRRRANHHYVKTFASYQASQVGGFIGEGAVFCAH